MIAFEISLNGTKCQTISVGELGWLSADISWIKLPLKSSGQINQDFRIIPAGMKAGEQARLRWSDIPLKVGDTVSIRVVESEYDSDAPEKVIPLQLPATATPE